MKEKIKRIIHKVYIHIIAKQWVVVKNKITQKDNYNKNVFKFVSLIFCVFHLEFNQRIDLIFKNCLTIYVFDIKVK
jgi:hypothetical protein